jgi:Domain of Unknown Function (DUF1206)
VTANFLNGFAFLIYLGLALTAGALALGWNAHVSADRNAESRHLSARILTVPFGRPLLSAVAVGVLVAAVVQVRWAFGPNHIRERLRVDEMTERQCKVVMGVGRIAGGLAVFFFIVGAPLDRSVLSSRGLLRASVQDEIPIGSVGTVVVLDRSVRLVRVHPLTLLGGAVRCARGATEAAAAAHLYAWNARNDLIARAQDQQRCDPAATHDRPHRVIFRSRDREISWASLGRRVADSDQQDQKNDHDNQHRAAADIDDRIAAFEVLKSGRLLFTVGEIG